MRRVFVLLLLVSFPLVSSPSAFATKYAGEFLSLGVGARALGMGGAFASVADDASAAYWNPAGICRVSGQEALFMHSETFGSIVNYDFIGYVRSSEGGGKRSAFGGSFLRLGTSGIPYTRNLSYLDYGTDRVPNTNDQDGTEGNGQWDPGEEVLYDEDKIVWVNDNEMALLLTYGLELRPRILVGANAKLVRKSVGDNSAFGMGLDAGVLAQVSPRLSLGVVVQDLTGTYLSWDTGTRETITPTLKTGCSVHDDVPWMRGSITLALDADLRFEGRQSADQFSLTDRVSANTHAGIEYWYREVGALRLGSDQGKLTAGLGFLYRQFKVDYAFLSNDDLGNSHRISGGVKF
jgi:hypothetical protein